MPPSRVHMAWPSLLSSPLTFSSSSRDSQSCSTTQETTLHTDTHTVYSLIILHWQSPAALFCLLLSLRFILKLEGKIFPHWLVIWCRLCNFCLTKEKLNSWVHMINTYSQSLTAFPPLSLKHPFVYWFILQFNICIYFDDYIMSNTFTEYKVVWVNRLQVRCWT